MSVKLARWGLHFYALPYRREIVWANAVEKAGLFALLEIEGDNGVRGIAEGTIKSTWSGVSVNSLRAAFEDFLMPRLHGVDISSPAAVAQALAGIPENKLGKGMIDSAVWTLHAAMAGQPLWQLWGGTREVDLTWAITRQAPLVMAREASEVCARYGFRTLKVKALPALNLERAKAVARANLTRLARHHQRRLPCNRPREINFARATPQLPQRLPRRRRMQRPDGAIDHALGKLVFRYARKRLRRGGRR